MDRNQELLQAVVEVINTETASSKCFAMKGDVRSWEIVEAVVKKVVLVHGRIDILVNGAAGNFVSPADKLTSNAMKTVLETDTLGVFHMSKAVFVNSMKENRSGNIINISARTAETGAALMSHANAAKAGVDALSKVFAVEWGPYGVRVNTLTPGYIRETLGYRKLGSVFFKKNANKMANPDPSDKDFATD